MFKKLADFFRAYGYQVRESRTVAAVSEQRTAEDLFLFDQLNRNA